VVVQYSFLPVLGNDLLYVELNVKTLLVHSVSVIIAFHQIQFH